MNDALGDRMKNYYENRYRIYLTRRTPVIIRVDGNAFHTFTKGLERPFDADFMDIMQKTCKELCKNIQGCVGGYVQSDEISLLLIDYQNLNTDAWFDYNLQKITSLAAAMATVIFNNQVDATICYYRQKAEETEDKNLYNFYWDKYDLWSGKKDKAIFDARAFNVPKEDVTNYFIWRQKDATRNSIQSAGQAVFSHKELDHKSQSDIQEMLFQKGINWNDHSIPEKRGSFVRRGTSLNSIFNKEEDINKAHPWFIDKYMPILTEDRKYIESLLLID